LVGTSLAAALLAAPVLVHASPTGYVRCYEARRTKDTPKFVPISVSLQDQFNSASSTVKFQRQLCNPSSVDGAFAPGIDQTAHLTCYGTKDQSVTPKFKHVDVQVTNVFGTQQLTLSKPFRLCVPSEKGIVPAAPTPSSLQIDHYRCYKANFKKGFTFTPPTGVSIADQFESTTADVRPGNRLIFCNPVSKNGAPILDPATHLTCFRLIEPPSDPNIDVAVDNQFGAGQRLTVRRQTAATSLCLPSSKTVLGSPTSTTTSTTSTSTTTSTTSTSTTTTLCTDAQCNDGDACTIDRCAGGTCIHLPTPGCCHTDAECNDGDACTIDNCAGGTCIHLPTPMCCHTDAECNDGNPCTIDSCTANRCSHFPIPMCP